MCSRRPKPPKVPKAQPRDSAIEETAGTVVVGSQRTDSKRKKVGSKSVGLKRMGTRSLQIPLLVNTMSSTGSLNYPT